MTWVTHHADIEPPSVRKYSLVVAQAVALVLRNHQRLLPICKSYHFDPPAEITAAASQLIEAFTKAALLPHSASSGDEDVAVQDAADEDAGDEDADHAGPVDEDAADAALADVRDDVFDDDEFEVPADYNDEPIAPATPLRPPPTCAIIQPPLRALIRALYCQLPPKGTEYKSFDSPIVKFLVMASKQLDGEWKKSSGITQIIAALTFAGRLSMYDLMRIGLHQHADTTIYE